MGRIGVTTIREPWGTILILAPSNYPLLLPGVQIVQALAAGNAVLVKPAPNGEPAMESWKKCLVAAGIPSDLLQILPTSVEAAEDAIEQGVDKVILTGSAQTGRAVLRRLSRTLTPSTLELSGCDAVFIMPQANLQQATRAIAYALQMNGGATCIAPRRIFVTAGNLSAFNDLLIQELNKRTDGAGNPLQFKVAPAALAATIEAVEKALAGGATLLAGELPETVVPKGAAVPENPAWTPMQTLVLNRVQPSMEIARSDLFAPVASVISVDDMSAAINADRLCPFRLGVSIFGPRNYAEHWARRVDAGCVVINDVVVPTGDPRVSFGGRDESGWGVTRGPDGLLEMTRSKTICMRRGKWLPHLDPELSQDADLMADMLSLFHDPSWRAKFQAGRNILARVRRAPEPQKPLA